LTKNYIKLLAVVDVIRKFC